MTALPKRSELKQAETWNLESIYPSVDAWEADYAQAQQRLPELAAFTGKLGESADQLLAALRLRDELSTLVEKLYVYAHMRKDEDNTNPTYQGLEQRGMSLYVQLSGATSFFDPEIIAIPAERLQSFLQQNKDLALYTHLLQDLMRQQAHVRSAEVEELLAQSVEIAQAPGQIFSMLNNADIKFPTIKDAEGNEIELTKGRYTLLLESHEQRVRRDAFNALYSTYGKQKHTLAACLSAGVKKAVFYARARNYDSALQMALDAHNIPVNVYQNLIDTVHKNLPRLHRYIELRKRLLGLKEVHMYDLYVPLVEEVNAKYSYEEAKKLVLEAVAPLGQEYVEIASKGLSEQRWVDVHETAGKTSGAYSGGSYATQPFMLLNFQENLDNVFTLAHELGHSMHSFFTRKNQPATYGDYTIFVAEVASTLNEALLTNYLLTKTDDVNLRKYLINHYLESFRATLYRQTMFAEFELLTHGHVEKGDALTPEWLCTTYKELNAKYFGDGVVLDEGIELEWARIPHFYNNFYVYQYATGISASAALSQQILQEGAPAVERYLGFLKSGSSKYSIDLLKGAGVDMASPEPVQQALDVFNGLLDQMEALI